MQQDDDDDGPGEPLDPTVEDPPQMKRIIDGMNKQDRPLPPPPTAPPNQEPGSAPSSQPGPSNRQEPAPKDHDHTHDH
jgi:hypothetical protein